MFLRHLNSTSCNLTRKQYYGVKDKAYNCYSPCIVYCRTRVTTFIPVTCVVNGARNQSDLYHDLFTKWDYKTEITFQENNSRSNNQKKFSQLNMLTFDHLFGNNRSVDLLCVSHVMFHFDSNLNFGTSQ